MNKEMRELKSRIIANIKNVDAPLNKREIGVRNNDLIVLGFIERNGADITNAYVLMGRYEEGKMNETIYFYDGMVLFSTYPNDVIGNRIENEDGFIETHEWWRIPTDDEIALYENVYYGDLIKVELEHILDRFGEFKTLAEVEAELEKLRDRVDVLL